MLDNHIGHFTGEKGGVRDGVVSSSNDPFEYVETVGGFNYLLVFRLTRGTNSYFHQWIKPNLSRNNVWHKLRWQDVTVEEMYHFLGILL